MSELLNRLLGPGEPEITCEQCFDLLDEYVELELQGGDADADIPGMRAHLSGCPACHDDHETLLAFVSTREH
jgi:hypothetical protein